MPLVFFFLNTLTFPLPRARSPHPFGTGCPIRFGVRRLRFSVGPVLPERNRLGRALVTGVVAPRSGVADCFPFPPILEGKVAFPSRGTRYWVGLFIGRLVAERP